MLAWSAALLAALITIVVVFSDLASLHRRARDLGAPRDVLIDSTLPAEFPIMSAYTPFQT